jgi:hypothetical protein
LVGCIIGSVARELQPFVSERYPSFFIGTIACIGGAAPTLFRERQVLRCFVGHADITRAWSNSVQTNPQTHFEYLKRADRLSWRLFS